MGEGALANELQDALTRSVLKERSGEFDSSQRLTYEWTFLLTSLYKLEQQERDQTLAQYPDIVDYAYETSARMADLDELVEYVSPAEDSYIEPVPIHEIVKLRKLPKVLDAAEDTYYAHNGLHETAWRQGRLKTIASIFDYHLRSAPYKISDRDFIALPSNKRLAASVNEELSTLSRGPEQDHYQSTAYKLNQEIVSNPYTPWYDQQKVHALFSLYDIDYRRALGPIMGRKDKSSYRDAEIFAGSSQRRFYIDLYDRAHYVTELLEIANQSESSREYMLWNGRAMTLTGTLLEMQALGELRDSIIARKLLLTIEARQSFLREDNNPRVHRFSNPKKYMATPNFSFDLVLQAHGSRGPMSRLNTEVKKAHEAESYLSGTFLLNAKDESSPSLFSSKLKDLCRAKIDYYEGSKLSSKQEELISASSQRMRTYQQIDAVLARAS